MQFLVYGLAGAAGGAAATLIVWAIADRALRRQLAEQVPREVGAEIDRQLRVIGITRQTGTQLNAILAAADRIGLIGIPRNGARRR